MRYIYQGRSNLVSRDYPVQMQSSLSEPRELGSKKPEKK